MAKENKTENEDTKTCQAARHDFGEVIFCERPLYDEEHCIFHSEEIERKKKEFEVAFWKEFERQKKEDGVFDFSGFVFPESITFYKIKFEKNTFFNGAKFLGENTIFFKVKFLGEYTYFLSAKFSGENNSFTESEFLGKYIYFVDANFLGEKADFTKTKFSGYTDFRDVKFSGKSTYFTEAKFLGEITAFREAEFSASYTGFNNAKFSGGEIDFSNSYFRNIDGLIEALIAKTKFLKRVKYKIKDFKFRLGEESARRYPLINRMTQDAWYLADFKNQHPKIYFVWWLFADCGRSILRWAAWSLGIAIVFAILFMIIGQSAFETRHHTWFSFFYYSVVTFTTLGFGDITPTKWFTEILVTIEVILGYIMLGGLVSIFAVKLARRS